jgi:hypothetical protein
VQKKEKKGKLSEKSRNFVPPPSFNSSCTTDNEVLVDGTKYAIREALFKCTYPFVTNKQETEIFGTQFQVLGVPR